MAANLIALVGDRATVDAIGRLLCEGQLKCMLVSNVSTSADAASLRSIGAVVVRVSSDAPADGTGKCIEVDYDVAKLSVVAKDLRWPVACEDSVKIVRVLEAALVREHGFAVRACNACAIGSIFSASGLSKFPEMGPASDLMTGLGHVCHNGSQQHRGHAPLPAHEKVTAAATMAATTRERRQHATSASTTDTHARQTTTGAHERPKARQNRPGKGGKSGIGSISAPSGFRHVGHIGWDPDKGFEVQNIPPEWKALFDKAGVTSEQLKDKQAAKIIQEFVAGHGGFGGPPRRPAEPTAEAHTEAHAANTA